MILDEPTSVLTPQEADEVLAMIRGMCSEGKLSVLMISHKFREVMAFCDEITVLRHGRFMGEGLVKDLDTKAMAQMMMGTASLPEPAVRADVNGHAGAAAVLRIENLKAEDEIGTLALDGINLEVRPFEIVGLAGVSGNGQRELVQVLNGQRAASSGADHHQRKALRRDTPRNSRSRFPRASRDAAAKRLRRRHEHGREHGLPPFRPAPDDLGAVVPARRSDAQPGG